MVSASAICNPTRIARIGRGRRFWRRAQPIEGRALLIFLCSAILLNAQSVQWGIVLPFSEGGVTFSPFNPEEEPKRAESLERVMKEQPGLAAAVPFTSFLTNSTNKRIVGLTYIWTWLDSSGRARPYVIREDLLFTRRGYIFAPIVSKLLITPLPFWQRVGEERSSAIETLTRSITVENEEVDWDTERFDKNTPLTLEFDAVILEDGSVIGQDRSNTLAYLRAKKEAADYIAKTVLQDFSRGQNSASMLQEKAARKADLSDPVGYWHVRIARAFLDAPDQKSLAEQLLTIPDINLHRPQ